MSEISRLTGQSDALRRLLDWYDENDNRTIRIEGPAGSGKSWLADRLVAYGTSPTSSIILAVGDLWNAGRRLIPFMVALESAGRFSRIARVALPELTRAVPQVGSSASILVQNILQYDELRQSRQTPYLDQAERDLLYELQRVAKEQRLVLVLDNLHWWDEASLDLLILMVSGRLEAVFPFLKDCRYVAIFTPEQSAVVPDKLQRLQSAIQGPTLRLDRCSEANFEGVLMGLGLRNPIDPPLAATLHRLCGGHLAIASQIVAHLNTRHSVDDLLHHADFESFCRGIIGLRLAATGEHADQLEQVLTYAAVIGLSFKIRELTCLAKEVGEQLSDRIREAITLAMIIERDDLLTFSHEVFPRLLAASNSGLKDAHNRFADCLKLLRPGDYIARVQHLNLAGRIFDARTMRTHLYLREIREGRARSGLSHKDELVHDTLSQFQTLMHDSMLAFDRGDYQNALAIARGVDEALPASLIAERDLLVARTRSSMLSPDDQRQAIQLLSRWDDLWDDEFEVWSRIAHTRIVILAEVGRHEEAKDEARRLGARLRHRIAYDPDAQRAFYRLRLKADTLYEPEAARIHLLEALDYFAPPTSSSAARDPLNYYICLCNLSGNDYVRGDFESAYQRASLCDSYRRQVERSEIGIRFPRPDFLANNHILSSFRTGRLSAADAGTLLEQLITTRPATSDVGLLASNRGGFLILEQRYAEALSMLEPWLDRFAADATFDAFYAYYIGNNVTASLLALSNRERARETWNSISSILPLLPEPTREYLVARHQILSAAILQPNATLSTWQHALDKAAAMIPVGPAWKHLGQPVLFSDLQFWSED